MGILVYCDRGGEKLLLGRIEHDRGKVASFAYESDYVHRARAAQELGLSNRLPLDAKPYPEQDFGPFFQGLLPEGEVRGALAQSYQIPRNDYLALIERLGCESIGALTFAAEDADEREFTPRYEPLVAKTVSALKEHPVRAATEIARSTRLSLAGAQSKVAWTLSEGRKAANSDVSDWLVPYGTAPSTHIVKISHKGEEDLAANELACSVLAASCGIETAEVSLAPAIDGAIAVKRYDRVWINRNGKRQVARLHQEDFCQALGLYPHYKYQPEGVEASYPIFAANLIQDTCVNPAADRVEFAKRLAFNFAVGNSDAHFKNSSLLYNPAWTARRLAPLYDVTCIPLSGYSTKMPFDIGEHRELADIDEKDILSIALDLDISLDSFDAAVREVVRGMEAPRMQEVPSEALPMIDRVLENSRPRIEVLRRVLG
ncbi:MAG: HipA domain-containing protein [Eggerthellaceae bacterium]|nr:HipA domain-containing protein [Eggerthellaceae bacterium]